MTTPPLQISSSRHFTDWLAEEAISLAFTTYQTNRLFLIGLKEERQLSAFERHFERPMGLYAFSDRLIFSSRYQLWQLDHALPPGETYDGYDRLYVPRRAHTTGELDIHDLTVDEEGRIIFANTLYSCLATTCDKYSFRPIWKPPFISRLAPEDRCHLNGLAMENGRPRYVTAVSRSDVAAGWRDRRHAGGVLIDVQTDEIIVSDLSMPHSPRVHEGKVWLGNAGSGELGFVDVHAGRPQFEPVAFCPGYLRGLAIRGDHMVVGLSKPRGSTAFQGLALDDNLQSKHADPRCGLMVINSKTGNVDHWLTLEGVVTELYDVQILEGVGRPMALGFKTDEIERLISIEYEEGVEFQALSTSGEQSAEDSEQLSLNNEQLAVDVEPLSEEAQGLYEQGRQAHMAGKLKVAETFYRRVLGQAPGHGDTLQYLGILYSQEGNPYEALNYLQEAINADPSNPTYYYNLAEIQKRMKNGGEAARRSYQQVIQMRPDFAPAHYALANLLVRAQRFDEARVHYEQTINLEPDHAGALLNLGNLLYQQGEMARAVDAYRQAVIAGSDNAKAHANLAMALSAMGAAREAIEQYEQACRLAPDDASLWQGLSLAYYNQGFTAQAKEAVGRSLQLDANNAEAHNSMGALLKLEHDFPGALGQYDEALHLQPDFALALRNRGLLLEEMGDVNAAKQAYRRSDLDPLLQLHTRLMCPPIWPNNEAIDQYRQRAKEIIGRYQGHKLPVDFATLHTSHAEPPLNWAYQGREDDLEMKLSYARLFAGQFPDQPLQRHRPNRPRLGLVVTPGHEGVFARAMSGLLNHFPLDWEVMVVAPRPGLALLRQKIDNPDIKYLPLPMRFDQILALLHNMSFDILYHWEVGTDSNNYFLPFCRLAPAQMTSWGWPDTSGTPQMDYYVSSEGLVGEESGAHFSEELIRLPTLPPFLDPPPIPQDGPGREAFDLPADKHLCLCAQNLRKFHPDFDPILGDILRGDPDGLVLAIADKHEPVTRLLAARWQQTLPDVADRLRILPRLTPEQYFALLPLADVALDTIYFGGALTTYDVLGAAVPLVTMPWKFHRSRFAAAAYGRLGIEETIASTPQEYVDIALRLGQDAGARKELKRRIAGSIPRLFGQPEAIAAWEEALLAIVR